MGPALHQLIRDPFELIVPLILLAATLLGGWILRKILFRVVRGWAARTDSHLDVPIIESLRGPILLWSLILGLHLATQNSEIPRVYLRYIPPTLAVLWILSLTIAISHLAGNMVLLYGRGTNGSERSVTSLTRKLAQVIVVIVGLVAMLKVVFNMSLTPILTTLGVGGLAVALALQDTLSNLFAGLYVSISGLVRLGDYIKLNTGEEGYVTDINWRCTTLRGITNNLVVIPNSKLGQATFTNYFLPERRMVFSISFGVGYDSDVDRVEAILLDETTTAAVEVPGMVVDPAPYVRFIPGPGDFALVFQINFSLGEFGDQYHAQSELRKRLFKRMQREGITMPYPTQTVILESKNRSTRSSTLPDSFA